MSERIREDGPVNLSGRDAEDLVNSMRPGRPEFVPLDLQHLRDVQDNLANRALGLSRADEPTEAQPGPAQQQPEQPDPNTSAPQGYKGRHKR